jgi:hypothetical protein
MANSQPRRSCLREIQSQLRFYERGGRTRREAGGPAGRSGLQSERSQRWKFTRTLVTDGTDTNNPSPNSLAGHKETFRSDESFARGAGRWRSLAVGMETSSTRPESFPSTAGSIASRARWRVLSAAEHRRRQKKGQTFDFLIGRIKEVSLSLTGHSGLDRQFGLGGSVQGVGGGRREERGERRERAGIADWDWA